MLAKNQKHKTKLFSWWNWLLALFVFVLPWQTRWIIHPGRLFGGFWEYGSWSLYVSELLLILLILIGLICLIKRSSFRSASWRNGEGEQKKKINWLILFPFFLFFVWSSCSIIWSLDRLVACYYVFRLTETILLFYLIICLNIDWNKISWAWILSLLVQSALSISQFFNQQIFANKWLGMAGQLPSKLGVSVVETNGMRWLRAYGSFSHPNILAGWLVIGLLICLTYWQSINYHRQSLFKRLSVDFTLILSIVALGLTFSRSAWLALLIGLIIFSYHFLKHRHWKSVRNNLAIIGFTILIFCLFAWPLISARFSVSQRLEIKSINQRINNIQLAKEIIVQHSWRGVGLGNYTVALSRIQPNQPAWYYQPIHNIYYLILTELGFIGLFILIGLIIVLLLSNFSLWLILPLLVIGMFDHYLFSLWPGIILFYLILGISRLGNHHK